MAGVLRFSDYLGGPDKITIEEIFPSTQRTFTYNFNQNIAGWTWTVKSQTIIVDPITWDRYTGEPNFATSRVIGYFPSVNHPINSSILNVTNQSSGLVNLTIPADLYTGPLIPDARTRVAVSVVSFEWTTADTPTQTNSHRWAFLQSYEPGVAIGDPTTDGAYVAFSIGA